MSPSPKKRRRRLSTARRRASQRLAEMFTTDEKSRVLRITRLRARVIGPKAECPSVR